MTLEDRKAEGEGSSTEKKTRKKRIHEQAKRKKKFDGAVNYWHGHLVLGIEKKNKKKTQRHVWKKLLAMR